MRTKLHAFVVITTGLILNLQLNAQPREVPNPAPTHKTVIAGVQYEKDVKFEKKWGSHYRKEWSTPVRVKIVMLDTLAGGLIPYEQGGGRQTRTLRLRDKDGREYVLRSIDKSFGKALPEIYQGTFIETIINDQVSIAHPYSAVIISPMAQAAGIYYTRPQIIYVPHQDALGSFDTEFGNDLYLFEERPDENWETASNLGNSTNIVGTDKMLEELLKDNDNKVDQLLYVRSRLFDMFIGDWGRHEDQWRWATFNDGKGTIYKPVPRDRDQAFTLFDGKRLKRVISMADLDHLQSFDTTIQDVERYNFPARNLDRRVANQVTHAQWIDIAKELQQALTDKVITDAVKRMPPELFPISGNEIIEKLKSRRDHLPEYASTYYKFLAEAVDVVGSDKKDVFVVKRENDQTLVEVYKMETLESPGKKLVYSRSFLNNETDEIRLFGLKEDDVFQVENYADDGILLRIVGGEGEDVVSDNAKPGGKVRVYDKKDYKYESFEYDKRGFKFKTTISSVYFGYAIEKHKWGKEPLSAEHSIMAKYSFTREALNFTYNSTFYEALGKWNLSLTAGLGVPSVVNFFGVGNESRYVEYDRPFFRFRYQEVTGKIGVNRLLGKYHYVQLGTFYQSIKVNDDPKRFVSSFVHSNPSFDFERHHYAGGEASYQFLKIDHPIVPMSGISFYTGASYTHNFTNTDHSFTRLTADAATYLKLLKFLSLGLRVGGATNRGTSDFYQLNTLGSHENLRGFRKWRFYGKSMAYSNNELRFVFNVKSKLFNGKAGFVTFYDIGRVWLPGEVSDTWHSGYGGGLFIAPFNKILLSASVGRSNEESRVFTFRAGFFF